MATSVAIPQDIINNIIEAVDDDRDLLKNCALVSSSFLIPSRKRLFSEISLRNDRKACRRLHQFLVENPDIQSFVRSISITSLEIFKSHSLIAILRLPFCCLENFSIGHIWQHSDWNDFSSELKDALSTILHSSTLKTLCLVGIDAPIILFHDIHLTKLVLSSFFPNDFYSKQSRLLTSATSEGVTSDTVIDQCVWNFHEPIHGMSFPTSAYFSLIWDKEVPTEPIFLPFMSRLRVFDIYVNPSSATMSDFAILSFLIRSLCISLTSPATLEHIVLDLVFAGIDNPFNHDGFHNDFRDADVWRHLDSIITHPIGSRLQRVDIIIQYGIGYEDQVSEPDETEVMRPVFDALPLLCNKGILFVEVYAGG